MFLIHYLRHKPHTALRLTPHLSERKSLKAAFSLLKHWFYIVNIATCFLKIFKYETMSMLKTNSKWNRMFHHIALVCRYL